MANVKSGFKKTGKIIAWVIGIIAVIITITAIIATFALGGSILGLAPLIVADIAIVGTCLIATTVISLSAGKIISKISTVRNVQKANKAFVNLDKFANNKLSDNISQNAILKNSKIFSTLNLKLANKHVKTLVSKKYTTVGSEKTIELQNRIDAAQAAISHNLIAGKRKAANSVQKQLKGLTKQYKQAQFNDYAVQLPYVWTRLIPNSYTGEDIPDRRSEIGCLNNQTREMFKKLANSQQPSNELGSSVVVKYGKNSGLTSTYACLHNQSKMESAELLLLNEAKERAFVKDIFPVSINRSSMENKKSIAIITLQNMTELNKYIANLNKIKDTNIESQSNKYVKRANDIVKTLLENQDEFNF